MSINKVMVELRQDVPWRGPSEREWVERISAGALAAGGWPEMAPPWMKIDPAESLAEVERRGSDGKPADL